MKVLVLGKGIANDGVVSLLEQEKIEYDYVDPQEVTQLEYEYVVKAPGIPYTHEVIQRLLDAHLRIITDIELAMLLRPNYYICVTGSNGKTTTVTLITQMLSYHYKVIACGNIGYSVCRAVVEHPDADLFVVEASSFQLEKACIDPNISVLLNVHPCHLDHHVSFRNYIQSKANVTIHQSKGHVLVYSSDDVQLKKIVKNSAAKKVAFSTNSCLTQCYLYHNTLYFNGKKILKLNENLLSKEFLLKDVMAAVSTVLQIKKMTPRVIRKTVKQFKEVTFRLTKLNDYIYNDAKSTNPYSTIAAMKCFDDIELVCGGYDRKENLNCLNDYLHKIKRVYTYGDTKDKVYNYMTNHNVECLCFDSLDEAFLQAVKDRTVETILFSPMFASFDHFKNYIERGNYFNQLYQKYIG